MNDPHSQHEKWESRYCEGGGGIGAAARVLQENVHLLPQRGQALDCACGLGANALLLAAHGLETCAWDYSAAAIERVAAGAAERGLSLHAAVRNVVREPPPPESFDVIVVSRFLERALAPALIAALRPQGLLYYQTFTRARVDAGGPNNDAYRLADNELLELFGALQVLVYREEGRVGDTSRGFRNEAMLVAMRRA
jgi:tellurite methyltransferase